MAEKTKAIIEKSKLPYTVLERGDSYFKEVYIDETKVNNEKIDMGIISKIALDVVIREKKYEIKTAIHLDYEGKDSINLMNTIIPEYYESITGVKKDFTQISNDMNSKLKEETQLDKFMKEYFEGENLVRVRLGSNNMVYVSINAPIYIVE